MSKIFFSFILLMLTCQAVLAQTVQFRASDFTSAFGSEIDLDRIDCVFEYTIDEAGQFTLIDIDLTIAQKTYSIDEIGVESFDGFVLIGGLPDIGGMSGRTNDFWFYYSYTFDEVSGFSFAVSTIDDFFDANVIDRNVVIQDRITMVLDEDAGFILPSEGGRVNYDVTLQNYEPGEILSRWSVLTMPNGDHFPIHKFREIQVVRYDGTREFKRTFLNIPSWFDDGEYTLTWYLTNTSTLRRDRESLRFTKGSLEPEFQRLSTRRAHVINGETVMTLTNDIIE